MESKGKDTREPQVMGELNRCCTSLDNLESVINDLEKRLESVIFDFCPSTEVTEKEKEPSVVPLAGKIKDIHSRIGYCVQRIINIKNRIEL